MSFKIIFLPNNQYNSKQINLFLNIQTIEYFTFFFSRILFSICQWTFYPVLVTESLPDLLLIKSTAKPSEIPAYAGIWWRISESNRWPPACKAGALASWANPPFLNVKFQNLKFQIPKRIGIPTSKISFQYVLMNFSLRFKPWTLNLLTLNASFNLPCSLRQTRTADPYIISVVL